MKNPRVKICGITRMEDAELAVRLGADAVGFVFWPRSPRRVRPADARAIARALPPSVTRVGVFVNARVEEVRALVEAVGLDAVQLHGDEALENYRDVPARLIRAVTLESDAGIARAASLPAEVTVLVDAVDREKRGGTGRTADWARAAALAELRPVMLAGGLTADNVAAALAAVKPWGVDVSSGVEASPGVKSAARMEQFFAVVGR